MLKKILDFRGATGSPLFLPPHPCPRGRAWSESKLRSWEKEACCLGQGIGGGNGEAPFYQVMSTEESVRFLSRDHHVDRNRQMSSSLLGSKRGRHTETEGVPPRWDQGHSPRLVGCEQEQPGILITTLECAPLGGEQDPIATCQVSGPTTAEKHEPCPLPACGLPCGSSVEVGGVRSVCCSRGR